MQRTKKTEQVANHRERFLQKKLERERGRERERIKEEKLEQEHSAATCMQRSSKNPSKRSKHK